jgi:hypothetical protein
MLPFIMNGQAYINFHTVQFGGGRFAECCSRAEARHLVPGWWRPGAASAPTLHQTLTGIAIGDRKTKPGYRF